LADIYFPLTVLQIRYDVFPLRNRNFRNQYQIKNDGNSRVGAAQFKDQEYDDDDLFAY